jgi:hypothetical protein
MDPIKTTQVEKYIDEHFVTIYDEYLRMYESRMISEYNKTHVIPTEEMLKDFINDKLNMIKESEEITTNNYALMSCAITLTFDQVLRDLSDELYYHYSDNQMYFNKYINALFGQKISKLTMKVSFEEESIFKIALF